MAFRGRSTALRLGLKRAVWAGVALLSLAGVVTGFRAIGADQAYAQALQFQSRNLFDRQLESALESLGFGTFDHRAFLLAGDALDRLNRHQEAVAVYKRYRQVQPNLGAVLNNLGKALNAIGDHVSGESVLLRGRKILPNDRWILNNLAEAYRKQGMGEKALSLFDGISSLTADDHHNFGLLAAEADSFDQARGHYEEALRLNPNMHEIHYSLAGLMLLQGDLDGAIGSYEEYLKSPEPNPTLVRRTKGRLREAYSAYGKERLGVGDPQVARRLLEHAQSLGEATANDEHALAMAYGKLSLFAEAAGAARRATGKDPDLLGAFLTLANALYELGDPEAANYYEVFLRRWQGDPKLAELARHRLKRLRN
jgi:tetratricopeptide (TPR) repeat protein